MPITTPLSKSCTTPETISEAEAEVWLINTTNGKSGVELLWAGSGTSAANATIGFFSGRGYHDYYTAGNSIPNNATLTANTSPAGDVLISTKGFVAGDNYTIIIEVR